MRDVLATVSERRASPVFVEQDVSFCTVKIAIFRLSAEHFEARTAFRAAVRPSAPQPLYPGVPFAGEKIDITFTFELPHCEHTSRLCFGTSTKIMSFHSFSSSNVFTAWW
jgi:hypothetical protein